MFYCKHEIDKIYFVIPVDNNRTMLIKQSLNLTVFHMKMEISR